jgi:hypothetical protein
MESIKQAVKETTERVTASKKVADLQRDRIDPTSGDSRQRTDYGALIQDTDNWSVPRADLPAPVGG